MRSLMTLALSLGCIACVCSMARTLERHYRQGYVGSAVMFGRVLQEQSWGLALLAPEKPIGRVVLSDLTTVRPCKKGGGR